MSYGGEHTSRTIALFVAFPDTTRRIIILVPCPNSRDFFSLPPFLFFLIFFSTECIRVTWLAVYFCFISRNPVTLTQRCLRLSIKFGRQYGSARVDSTLSFFWIIYRARGNAESNCGWSNLRDNRWDFRYCARSTVADIIANKMVLLEKRVRINNHVQFVGSVLIKWNSSWLKIRYALGKVRANPIFQTNYYGYSCKYNSNTDTTIHTMEVLY